MINVESAKANTKLDIENGNNNLLPASLQLGSIRASVVVVGIIFSAFLILSNLTAFKLVTVGSISFPAGLVFFPLTYIFDDILTEVYGFKISRQVIWSALLASVWRGNSLCGDWADHC